jgi:UDP-N-acetyl-D-mannosaminuronate dehydrogenase
MAQVRSTARVSREGDEAEVTEIVPISEVMRRSDLIVSEGTIAEGGTTEAEQEVVEDRSDDGIKENNSILSPSKPSHIEFGKSTVTEEDLVMMKKLGYFGRMKVNLFALLAKK